MVSIKKPLFDIQPLVINEGATNLNSLAVSVEDFLSKGYLNDALINFVALLGWHPSDDKEIFSLKELENNFTINRVNKAGAIFDVKKLNWMNSLYLKNSSSNSLRSNVVDILKNM